MAIGKYSRVDNRRSSYCSTVTIVVFVALCLVGLWMMMTSSVVPVQNVDVPQEENNEVKEQITKKIKKEGNDELSNDKAKYSKDNGQFDDNPGDLPEDVTKGESSDSGSQNEEKQDENSKFQTQLKESLEEESKPEDVENKNGVEESNSESETKNEGGDGDTSQDESGEGSEEKKGDSDDNEKPNSEESEKNVEENESKIEEKVDPNDSNETSSDLDEKDQTMPKDQNQTEVFPSGAQSELLKETTTQNGAFSTQAAESKNEKASQQSSQVNWKLCNITAGPDYIPCLDNMQAIKSLTSTKHYEHRERHCPEKPPTCLVSLPEGYKRSVEWPNSREKIWYYNVPHTKLAQVKGHQNWVKLTGEYLTFPGGGTQFKHGALHYIDFIQESVPDIAWGKQTRVILDVGCGVASFGGFLFDRGVLAMSLAPKDEHEAQVQFALERGIPAISAVMGTTRLPFPGQVFDAVHCARCRVPWHIEGGKLLLELNRVLRPGGLFVWSATPVYQKLDEDVQIWNEMSKLTKAMCWELISINKDTLNGVGVATYRKPTTNKCYKKRETPEPPLCANSDDPNAAWYVPLRVCMHKVPTESEVRGSQWPEQWPERLEKTPYWLLSTQTGVYGKPAPEDFAADYKHWKRVVSKSYLTGIGIDWKTVRNVMDMRSVYGGFAAALKDLSIWVMNVVSVDAPDTLPIIYERGLFGIYHDWCESFSTYPRTYDLLHADHLFSKVKTKCKLEAVVAEVDRILRPEGKLIVRDDVETISQLESMLRSMQWEVRLTYTKDNEGLLCIQKSMWRPAESETLTYAIA